MLKYEDLIHRFRGFMSGVRVLMLIDRGVMNANKGSKRWINKIITTNEDEWKEALQKLMALQDYMASPDVRLYATINARDIDKAIRHFQHAQIECQPDNKMRFYAKINNTFCSSLMKQENKSTKLWLLDIDGQDMAEVDNFVLEHDIKVVYMYPSKSGIHYIVKPFDSRLADGRKTFVLLKDGLLLVRYI